MKFYHTVTNLNFNTLASKLPALRCLQVLRYRNADDPTNFWPLRQCAHLEKLIMHNGCAVTPCFLQCCSQSRVTEVSQEQMAGGRCLKELVTELYNRCFVSAVT
jgi:hypothetical protein